MFTWACFFLLDDFSFPNYSLLFLHFYCLCPRHNFITSDTKAPIWTFDFLLSLLHLFATRYVQSCFFTVVGLSFSSLIHCFSYSLVEAVPYLWFSAHNDSTKVIWKFVGYTQANPQASSHNYQITNSGIQTHVFNSLLKKASVWKFKPHRPMLSLLSVIRNRLFLYSPLLCLLESR